MMTQRNDDPKIRRHENITASLQGAKDAPAKQIAQMIKHYKMIHALRSALTEVANGNNQTLKLSKSLPDTIKAQVKNLLPLLRKGKKSNSKKSAAINEALYACNQEMSALNKSIESRYSQRHSMQPPQRDMGQSTAAYGSSSPTLFASPSAPQSEEAVMSFEDWLKDDYDTSDLNADLQSIFDHYPNFSSDDNEILVDLVKESQNEVILERRAASKMDLSADALKVAVHERVHKNLNEEYADYKKEMEAPRFEGPR